MVAGCEDNPSNYYYYIDIKGLNNFTSGGPVEIYVPLVLLNGSQIFDDSRLRSPTFPDINWTPQIIDTDKGKMISFKTNSARLTDLHYGIRDVILNDVPFNERRTLVPELMKYPLVPVVNGSTANYTYWTPGENKSEGYTTYVYIDKNIKPINENSSIYIDIVMGLSAGTKDSKDGPSRTVHIQEIVPADVTGWIPVEVQYGTKIVSLPVT